MDDTLFNSLGLMAWYKYDLDKLVGNDFIENYKNNDSTKVMGTGSPQII